MEAGLWSHDDAVAFAASGLEDRCLRALVEPHDPEPGAAIVTAAAIDGVLGEVGIPLPRLHHGYDMATWYVLDAAVPAGRDIRIGFEDTLTLPGRRAARATTPPWWRPRGTATRSPPASIK